MPEFVKVGGSLPTGTGADVTVVETRKGTMKKVLELVVNARMVEWVLTHTSTITFDSVTTNDIKLLPSATGCDGDLREIQKITTTTADTTSTGGDATVSPLTTFTLSYAGETTEAIYAQTRGQADARSRKRLSRLPSKNSTYSTMKNVENDTLTQNKRNLEAEFDR